MQPSHRSCGPAAREYHRERHEKAPAAWLAGAEVCRLRRRLEKPAADQRHHTAVRGGKLSTAALGRLWRCNVDAGTALIDRHPDTRFIIDHLAIMQPRTGATGRHPPSPDTPAVRLDKPKVP